MAKQVRLFGGSKPANNRAGVLGILKSKSKLVLFNRASVGNEFPEPHPAMTTPINDLHPNTSEQMMKMLTTIVKLK